MTEVDYLREACRHAASHSDDPRTQVGALLVQSGHVVREANRIPRGVYRDPARLEGSRKYRFVEHAERGVIYKAASLGVPTVGSRLYCPWFACTDCARAMICSGVAGVVGLLSFRQATPERWEEEISTAERMLSEAGVSMRWLAGTVGEQVLFDGVLFDC